MSEWVGWGGLGWGGVWWGVLVLMHVAFREYIADKLEGGQKMIVFGHHRSLINCLGTALESRVSLACCEGEGRGGEGRDL